LKILPHEKPEEFHDQARVREVLKGFVDIDAIELWRSAVYRFHALVAASWSRNRVFLLGDCAHQMPPFLGQGMCAGIRDAANLAWKLAMALQEGAPDALLDTYEDERKPHVRTLVATAKEFGLIIGELDPEAARIRDETLCGQLGRGEAETIRQRFIPDLASGVIDSDPDARAAGTLFVQPKIKRHAAQDATCDEVLLDDLLRFRFLIVTTTGQAQAWLTSESHALWNRLGGERIVIGTPVQARQRDDFAGNDIRYLVEADDLFAAWMSQHGCAAVVVRPDRYVFGTANDGVQLNRLVAAVGRHVLAS
jgi:3-(3-hydroxy-phenyl)propionate hydroxylase